MKIAAPTGSREVPLTVHAASPMLLSIPLSDIDPVSMMKKTTMQRSTASASAEK